MPNVKCLTEVRLLTVPLDQNYQHTLYFATKEEQETYFTGKVYKVDGVTSCAATELYYQRKDKTIKYPMQYDDINVCNYVMYKNEDYADKWYYAFITSMEYATDGMTQITIETDVVQTWLFDYKFMPSFIEREHVMRDIKGAHTVPENLETGEYICDGVATNEDLKDLTIIVGATIDLNNYANQPDDWTLEKRFSPVYGNIYDGVYSGLKYFSLTPSQLDIILRYAAREGQDDAIHVIFMAPKKMISLAETSGAHATNVLPSQSAFEKTWTCATKPIKLNGYVPKNNKLLTYPYCYLMVDNGGGGAVNYNYEKFAGDNINFKINSVITPGMSIRAVPLNYNGVTENNAEGINLSKYSTCSWASDTYTSWLAKNSTNMAVSTVTTVGLAAAGAALAPATLGASSVAVAAAMAGVGAVAHNVGQVAQHAKIPPQLHGNTNNGDVATSTGNVTLKAYQMSIKSEYAEIIDLYFDMYGYKVNSVKMPNTNHRENWWYTKTVDANIFGELPPSDLQKIKDCYNRGITFWRTEFAMGFYGIMTNKALLDIQE